MFVPLWLLFLTSGTVFAVLTIVWAIRARQFDDQARARFLPLAGLGPNDYAKRGTARTAAQGVWVTALLVGSGILVMGATVLAVVRPF